MILTWNKLASFLPTLFMLFAAGEVATSEPTGAEPSPPPSTSEAAPPPPPESEGMRQLRTNYEGIKSKYEPWEKLGVDVKTVSGWRGTYDKLYSQAAELGQELGYSDEELVEALQAEPYKTLQFLHDQMQRGGQADENQELADLVAQQVDQRMGPIEHRENVRITNEANALFERTVHDLSVDLFKKEGLAAGEIPQDEMFLLMNATSEILKYDNDALVALKTEGKTGAVQRAFQDAVAIADKYYLSRSARERSRATRGGPPGSPPLPPSNSGKRPTLDEMIDDPGRINEKYRA